MKTLRRVILEAKIDGIEINSNSRGGDALKFAADAKTSLKGFKRERGRRGRGGKPKGSGRAPGGGYTLNGQPITDPNLKSNVGGSRRWRKHEFARARNAVKTDPQTTLQTSNTAYPLTAGRVFISEKVSKGQRAVAAKADAWHEQNPRSPWGAPGGLERARRRVQAHKTGRKLARDIARGEASPENIGKDGTPETIAVTTAAFKKNRLGSSRPARVAAEKARQRQAAFRKIQRQRDAESRGNTGNGDDK